jgi:hypothetical protein
MNPNKQQLHVCPMVSSETRSVARLQPEVTSQSTQYTHCWLQFPFDSGWNWQDCDLNVVWKWCIQESIKFVRRPAWRKFELHKISTTLFSNTTSTYLMLQYTIFKNAFRPPSCKICIEIELKFKHFKAFIYQIPSQAVQLCIPSPRVEM